MSDIFRRKLDQVGKGGIHCYCCNDYTDKKKPILNRKVRRTLKAETVKEISKEV